MKSRIAVLLPTLVVVASSHDAVAFTPALAHARENPPDVRVEAIDITLYQNLAWVRELRRQQVGAGVVDVTFAELATSMPASAEFRAVDDLGEFHVLSLDYPNAAAPGDIGRTTIARVETAAGDRALELSYVSPEMTWHASYTATLRADGSDVTLTGYAHIVNRTQRAFPNATIRLVSGVSSNGAGIDNATDPVSPAFSPLARAGEKPPAWPRPILEVRSLDLESATVRDGHSKQVEFMRVPGVALAVEHRVEFSEYYGSRPRSDRAVAGIVAVFRNDATNGLGRTLPGGNLRLFAIQADGRRALVGTGSIQEAKAGEAVRVVVGHDGDVTAIRTLVAYDGDRRTRNCEQTFRVVLKSRKPHDVTVDLRDAGSQKLLRSTHEPSGDPTLETAFKVAIPANSTTEVTYTGLFRCE